MLCSFSHIFSYQFLFCHIYNVLFHSNTYTFNFFQRQNSIGANWHSKHRINVCARCLPWPNTQTRYNSNVLYGFKLLNEFESFKGIFCEQTRKLWNCCRFCDIFAFIWFKRIFMHYYNQQIYEFYAIYYCIAWICTGMSVCVCAASKIKYFQWNVSVSLTGRMLEMSFL